MTIRIGDPIPGSQSIVLLVEDAGLLVLLPQILEHTSIAKYDVDVVGGEGWQSAYQKYDRLRKDGVATARIVPVLDGDTLGQKGPRSAIHENSRMFRFQFDLELAFAT